MKILKSLFALAVFSLAAASVCSADPKNPKYVSLMPSNTEILFALGAGDSIVGDTKFCDYPEGAKKISKVGDFIHPDMERILALKPDVVFAGHWPSSKTAARLRELGLKVVEIPLPATLEDIYGTIHQIAKEVGKEKEADALVTDLQKRVQAIERRALERNYRPRIFIHIDEPNWTVSKGSFISDAMERCGAVNIFRDLKMAGSQVSSEAVIEKDPEVIILSRKKKEEILRTPGWQAISAVKNHRLVDGLGANLISRPTPRLISAMERLSWELSEMKFK